MIESLKRRRTESDRLDAPLAERYTRVREQTERLCAPLAPEDCVVQSMPDASPAKWHLAHASWFFETFLLQPHLGGYRPFHPGFGYLFNSYYLSVGERHCRARRGLLSRPTVAEVYAYRHHVDGQMRLWMSGLTMQEQREFGPLIELGLHHEQQHQELILTDIKHLFWINPLRPVYCQAGTCGGQPPPAMHWIDFDEGTHIIGYQDRGFCYDNELPAHRVLTGPFAIGSRPVTNGEYRCFMDDGGYDQGTLWLSDGWAEAQQEQWRAPLYWFQQDGEWMCHTLGGVRAVADDEPVCHVSLFEADAYARWAGARLPTEFEWEIAARRLPIDGNFVERGALHPAPMTSVEVAGRAGQMFGDVWEWTASQYSPYPGYAPSPGAVGEYNGKFMCNQFVLRGGSCATPASHIRPTYRNFFPPAARWQFSGIRLARMS